jgi:hypothetical protein
VPAVTAVSGVLTVPGVVTVVFVLLSVASGAAMGVVTAHWRLLPRVGDRSEIIPLGGIWQVNSTSGSVSVFPPEAT